MKERFEGDGRPLLIEALRRQAIVLGSSEIATAIADAGELAEYRPGDTLIVQDGADNDVLFVVAGSVAIVVNGTQVATRKADTHIGDMSAIEPTQPRAASAIAEDLTVVVKLPNPAFQRIAESHPVVWKPLAQELARRLYQRNKLMPVPNEQPKLFIISSAEALDLARELQSGLQHDVLSVVWTDGVFFASGYALEILEAQVEESDFAVAVTRFEDIVESRGQTLSTLRDNVVFELGLFMGRLGRHRTVLLHPRKSGVKLPSDLHGLTAIAYAEGKPENLTALLAPACNEVRKIIKKFGVRTE